MDEVKAAIVAALDANGGKITWQQVIDAAGPGGRRYILNAMSALERENVAKRQNRFSAEEGAVFEVVKIVS